MYKKLFGKQRNMQLNSFSKTQEQTTELFFSDNYRIDYDPADTSKLMEHKNFIVDHTYVYTQTGFLLLVKQIKQRNMQIIFDSLMMFLVGALSHLASSTMVLNGKKPPLPMVQ